MKRTQVLPCARASVLALSLLVLPHHTPFCADNDPWSYNAACRNARRNTGGARLYGFMGLTGVAGPRRAYAVSASGSVRTYTATDTATGTRERSRP